MPVVPFLKACRREPADVTPIWLMRQAGRYMPEYRAIRSKVSFLELCKRPELATEVTVTAAERLGVDAAILFADILLILEPLGFELEFAKGEGPIIHNPVRTGRRRRPGATAGATSRRSTYVIEAVRSIRAALPPAIPLIGFAGAPFTLACYAIEGGGSRHYEQAKTFMYRDPGAWNALMDRLADATALYLNAQAAAGAQALQVFDSWVGTLSPRDYRGSSSRTWPGSSPGSIPSVPVIHFGTGTAIAPGAPARRRRHRSSASTGGSSSIGLAAARSRRRRSGQSRSGRPARVPLEEIEARPAASSAQAGGPPGPYLQPRARHPPANPRRQRPRLDRHRSRQLGALTPIPFNDLEVPEPSRVPASSPLVGEGWGGDQSHRNRLVSAPDSVRQSLPTPPECPTDRSPGWTTSLDVSERYRTPAARSACPSRGAVHRDPEMPVRPTCIATSFCVLTS